MDPRTPCGSVVPIEENQAFREAHLATQALLGRCLMRIQQYERQTKLIVALSRLDIMDDRNDAAWKRRLEEVKTLSLGLLNRELLEDAIVSPSRAEAISNPQTVTLESGSTRLYRFLQISDEQHQQLTQDLDDMRVARNAFAHHFLDENDVFSLEGCEKANKGLERLYDQIERALARMMGFAQQFRSTQMAMRNALESACDGN